MKYRDLIRLQAGLISVGNLPGAKFAYAVGRNIDKIRGPLKPIQGILKESSEFKEYNKQRIRICEDCAEVDNGGKAMKDDDGSYLIADAKKDQFDKKITALKKRYQTVIDDREKQAEEYNKLLDEESKDELNLHMVQESDLPVEIIDTKSKPPKVIREGITGTQMDMIREMIVFEEVKPKTRKKAAKK